ncbi:hypothetical protein ACQ4PT_023913 [Festuca glaucescens]
MPRRRAGSPPTPPNPTRRRQSLTPIWNPEPAIEMDVSLLQEIGEDRAQISSRPPAAIALAPAAAAARAALASNSHGLFPETELSGEEELQHSVVPSPQEAVPQPPPFPARHSIVPRRVDEKGKEPDEASKQICGICLSEEQRATLQGLLNCCLHYFCFTCILEWSKSESRCPVCKRRFNTITVADEGSGLRSTAIRVQKRDQVYQPSEEEMNPYENAICIECNQSGEDNLMLQCDVCESSAHTFCVGLGREAPEESWYCGGCRSTVEGPSYAQTQDQVVNHGESNMNTADSSSSSFGRSVLNGVSQRPPPPLNIHQPSLQGFDLNLSPVETPDEDKRAESHISAEPASIPTARYSTLDRRRALNRRIRILLSRPRAATHALQNGVENFREVANAKDQLIPFVKKSIKHICAQSPLDQTAFMNVARRATNTILALSGIEHNRDRVVATPFPFPSHCWHARDGREPAFLMRTICSACFNSFVGKVVGHIANMFSSS